MSDVYAGRQILIKVDLNGVGGAGANWTTIAQQRGGSLSRSSETSDATHKQSGGYPIGIINRTPWSISCDGALDPADPTWVYLLSCWEGKVKPYIQVDESAIGGPKKEGKVIITDLSHDFPESDVVTFTAEFTGDGALSTSP